MSSNLKIAAAFLFSAALLYLGFTYLLSVEQRALFFSIPFEIHVISVCLTVPGFFANGIELRLLYSRISKIRLSAYDTITLPFVINLWGFVLPFQGSLIYTTAYIYLKYKKGVADSLKAYLISFSIAMSIAGAAGLLFAGFSNIHFSMLFISACLFLLINPVFLYAAGRFAGNYTSNAHSASLAKRVARSLAPSEHVDKQLVVYLVLLKLLNVSLACMWAYWAVIYLKINFSLIQLGLIFLLMNLTMLVKILPGNIGINQFAAGGLALLVGGTANDGFMLSSFQYLTNIFIAIIFGGIFSFLNFKYFSWSEMKQAMKQKFTENNGPDRK